MNEFEYKIAIESIKKMKTQKAREELIRKYTAILPTNGTRYNTSIIDNVTRSQILMYKTIMLAESHHSSANGLPDFIYRTLDQFERNVFDYIVDSKLSYEYMIDVFEFTENIKTTSQQDINIKVIAEIVKDNPMPFEIIFFYNTRHPYTSIDNNITKNNKTYTHAKIYELENIKTQLDKNIRYTIIEDLLKIEYKYISEQIDTHKEKSNKMVDRMIQFKILSNIIDDKINGNYMETINEETNENETIKIYR